MRKKYNTANRLDICNLVKGSLILIHGMERHGSFEVLEIVRDTIKSKYTLTVRIYGTLPQFRYTFADTQTFEDGK